MQNQDIIPTMPNNEYMVKGTMTIAESLNYYKNWWTRMLTSFIIDVEFDKLIMAADPDAIVPDHNEEPIPVKIRLERRKMNVENAQRMLKAVENLIAVPEGEFHDRFLSEQALKVSDEVVAEQTGEATVEEPAPAADEPKVTDAVVVDPAQDEPVETAEEAQK